MKKRMIALLTSLTVLLTIFPYGDLLFQADELTEGATDYSSDIGKHATIIQSEEVFVAVLDTEPTADNAYDYMMFNYAEFSSDIVFSIEAYRVVTETYNITDETTGEVLEQRHVQSLWYQVNVVSGTAPEDFADGYWIFQNYVTEGEEYDSDTLSLFAVEQVPEISVTVGGQPVDEVTVTKAEKVTLSAQVDEGNHVKYVWQVYVPSVDLWVNVFRQTSADFTLRYGIVARCLDADGLAHIRCVATVDGEKVIGEAISVHVGETVSTASLMANGAAVMAAADDGDVGSTTIYNVIIQYVFTNGTQAANPWTATIEAGGDFTSTIKSPEVVGYAPDQEEVLVNIQDINEDKTYTVTYNPAEVDFIISHQMQNILDDNYTEFLRIPAKGFTDSAVGVVSLSESEMAALGVYDLPYDIEQKIAADGTTEVVIKYDRYYYLMNFVLGGGYNVEPIYARVGTPISVGIPIRAGYVFQGWDTNGDGVVDTLPATMPTQDTTVTAVWEADPSGTTYFIAYWFENANNDGYSLGLDDEGDKAVGVHTGVPGSIISGGATYGDTPGFHFDHADQNVTVKGDGSTVVNVYYKRNRYTLTFAYSGGPQICGGTHSHNNCQLMCGVLTEHTHSSTCCDRGGLHFLHTCNTNKCAYGYEHTHTDSCYDCGKVAHTSHSVNNGCYGVKFEGIKYGQDTTSWWKQAPTGYRWTHSVSGEGYTSAPDMPNGNLLVIGEELKSSYLYTIHYYEEGTTNKVRESISYYRSSDSYYLTSTDYIAIPGFTCLATGKTYPDSNLVYKIYYRRNNYALSFINGKTEVSSDHLYEADLSGVIDANDKLKNPEYQGDDPEGHTFGGWYTTEQCLDGTEWDPEGATMPHNNLMLYAKWALIKHQIKLYITKEDYEAGQQYLNTIVVDRNHTAQEPATPENGSYHFVGWFYMEDGVEKAYDFAIPVRKDMNLYGKWYGDELVPYTVYYKDAEGNEIAPPTTGSTLAGYDKTFEAKTGNDLYEDYRTGYYPTTNSHSMNVLMDADNTYTFIYIPKDEVKYTVRYLEKDTGVVLAPEKIATTTEAVHTENFVFVSGGYRPDAYQKRRVLSANEAENVITFWYVKDSTHAPVLVKHYLQNLDGVSYNTANPYLTTTDLDGVIDATYTVDVITTLEGFQFKSATASHEVSGVKTDVPTTINGTQVSAKVTPEGLLIELYYDRIIYPYEFRFLQQGTNAVLQDPIQGTARYGAQVTQAAISIPGYTCTSANQSMTIQSESGSTAVKNVRIFYYVEQTVTIQYVPVGGGTTSPSSQTNIPVISGIVGGSVATPNEGYLFKGWYSDAACTQLLTTDEKFTPAKNAYGQWREATYYAKFVPGMADLTIERTNGEDGQVYVYQIQSKTDPALLMYVTVVGNGSVTIHDLPITDYTVTQQNDWSWRHGDGAQNVTLDADGETITFDDSFSNDYWLNGNSELEKNVKGATG